jgi:hypothetical protein
MVQGLTVSLSLRAEASASAAPSSALFLHVQRTNTGVTLGAVKSTYKGFKWSNIKPL